MICTAGELREMLKGIRNNRLVEVTETTVTIIQRVPTKRKVLKANEVYTLLDSNVPVREIARRLKTSEQVIRHMWNARDNLLNKTEGNLKND